MNLFNHHSRSAGMTLIELAIVMGIVSLLLAMVLGLARHVDAIIKVRQAQAELTEWQSVLEAWHQEFGEYPYARIDTQYDTITPIYSTTPYSFTLTDPSTYPLALLTNDYKNATGRGCYVRYYTAIHPNGTNITFRSFMTTSINTADPWGIPYLYHPYENGKTYRLLSCGPNRQTSIEGHRIPSNAQSLELDYTIDDIYP